MEVCAKVVYRECCELWKFSLKDGVTERHVPVGNNVVVGDGEISQLWRGFRELF